MDTMPPLDCSAPAPQSASASVRKIGLASIIAGGLVTVSTVRRVLAVMALKVTGALAGGGTGSMLLNVSVKLALGGALIAALVGFMQGRPKARRWVIALSAALSVWMLQSLVRTAMWYGPNVFRVAPRSAVEVRNIFTLFGIPLAQMSWPIATLALAFRRDVRAFFKGQASPQRSQLFPSPAGADENAAAPQDRARAA